MKNGLMKLVPGDILRGLIVAVFTGVLTFLAQAVNAPAFDYATFDWAQLGGIAITAGVAYLSKNLLTTNDGSFLGKV